MSLRLFPNPASPSSPRTLCRFTSGLRALAGIVLATSTLVATAQPVYHYKPGSARKISQLSGDWDRPFGIPTRSLTHTRAGMAATDLGSTVEHNGDLLFLFGDTWEGRYNFEDTIGVSQSTDPFELEMDIPVAGDGIWRAMLPPGLDYDVFCVPSHGISHNGTLYIVFTQDGPGGAWMERSYMISTSDLGQTWQTLYALDNTVSLPGLSSPRFVNVWLERHGDFIYMFGCGEYRASSPMLARAPASQFPAKSAWRYYAGLDLSGNPRWLNGVQFAQTLFTHNEFGEFCATYVDTLECWVMLYNCGNPRGINMRTAANPWGPWSAPKVIMDPTADQAYGNFMHISSDIVEVDLMSDPGRESEWGGEYGPYIINRFTRGTKDHCELYYILSTWNPYQSVLMRAVVGQNPFPTPPPGTNITLDHDQWTRSSEDVADAFMRNGRPNLTTFTDAEEDLNTGWLWQRLPPRAAELSFNIHGGHAELFLLENFVDLPAEGDIEVISQNLRAGVYGRVARRATGVRDNDRDIPQTWNLTNLDPASLGVVVLDSFTDSWGFVSFSDFRVNVKPPPASVESWGLY